jgi:uncharacterized lipoprotein YajG
MKKQHTAFILVLTVTAALLSGCGDKRKTPTTENAPPAPTPEQIPAASAADLLTRDQGTVLAKVNATEFTLA